MDGALVEPQRGDVGLDVGHEAVLVGPAGDVFDLSHGVRGGGHRFSSPCPAFVLSGRYSAAPAGGTTSSVAAAAAGVRTGNIPSGSSMSDRKSTRLNSSH